MEEVKIYYDEEEFADGEKVSSDSADCLEFQVWGPASSVPHFEYCEEYNVDYNGKRVPCLCVASNLSGDGIVAVFTELSKVSEKAMTIHKRRKQMLNN